MKGRQRREASNTASGHETDRRRLGGPSGATVEDVRAITARENDGIF